MSLLVLLGACVIDSDLNPEKDPDEGFDDGDSFDIGVDSDSAQVPAEECNGLDDDGDGEVDEDFDDADGNGRADCLDAECPALDLAGAAEVEIPEECAGLDGGADDVVPDPWAVRLKWAFEAPAACPYCVGSHAIPAVGNLDDDNGDGVVDDQDSPEVVLSLENGWVVVLDGATGAEKWSSSGHDDYSDVMIADVDANGRPDIVTGTPGKYTQVLDGEGNELWTSTELASAMHYVVPLAADLDEDGAPEVIHDDLVLDGADGSVKFWMGEAADPIWDYRLPAIGDVDNDGDQEIALAGKLFDSDGTLLWDGGVDGLYGFWPVILQADADPEAEVGFVGNQWTLFDTDGTELYRETYATTAQPGPPCVADFDGDGQSEIAWPSYDTLVMYELDGTKVWAVPMQDSSGIAGCSGYDLDNDGALEVLYADESTFTIFDGATGAERWVTSDHASNTIYEYPTVADVDHDGHTEILVAENGGYTGSLKVYENDGDGWPAAGSTWGTHDFAITNLGRDGSVPRHPDAYWLKYNVYRARVAADEPALPDLAVAITDQCVADCTWGPVVVGVSVTNYGGATVDAGALVHLYADDDAGPRLVATQVLPEVPAGTRLEGIQFDLRPADLGCCGWLARVDEESALYECDETNNEDRWSDTTCP